MGKFLFKKIPAFHTKSTPSPIDLPEDICYSIPHVYLNLDPYIPISCSLAYSFCCCLLMFPTSAKQPFAAEF